VLHYARYTNFFKLLSLTVD